jgi:hypothetical protein
MDLNNNIQVAVDGNEQAIIGTDVYSSAGQTAHAQVMKVAWGNDSTVTRTTTTTPLPVQIYGITGTLSTVTVTGSVRGLGTFTVGNTAGSPVYVTGGVNSYVYGVTGAPPVAVTGSVNISSNVGITGTVNVTGGRQLNSSTDSVTVGGTVGRSWNLTYVNDNVKVYGSDGGLTLPVKIMGANGTIIGASGDAINVNMVNAGFSATVTFGAVVSVQNATDTILRVQGTANGTPIIVSGTVSLSDDEVTIGNSQLFVDLPGSSITYAGGQIWPSGIKNIEKLFSYYESNAAYTIPWYLRELRYDIAAAGGGTGSISNRLNQLVTDGSNVRTAPFTGVRTFNHVKTRIRTFRTTLNANTATQLTFILLDNIKHGVTIKNISDQTVILGNGVQVGASPVWSAPTSSDDFGIHLSSGESIFIPATINASALVADGLPPLYGKIESTNTAATGQIAIMAV